MSKTAVQTAILMTEVPAVIWAWWSFKMHKNWFHATPGSLNPQRRTYDNTFFAHTGTGWLYTGVCPLGKFGAWVILLWSMALIVMEFLLPTSDMFPVFIVHIAVMGIIFILSFIMNRPLWIRSIPFFWMQTIAATLLFALYST